MENQKKHWERIYATKQPDEVSWTQEIPAISLEFIHNARLLKSANIIDIGGGDSKLVDFLLNEGFENITVLDISEQALTRTKKRLAEKAAKVNWIVSDITDFHPNTTYDFWHDRATFHFLTTGPEISQYLLTARKAVKENAVLAIGTFSRNGPKKCSGLDIKQYSEKTLVNELKNGFKKIKCLTENHITPFKTTQIFIFCSFRKQQSLKN